MRKRKSISGLSAQQVNLALVVQFIGCFQVSIERTFLHPYKEMLYEIISTFIGRAAGSSNYGSGRYVDDT